MALTLLCSTVNQGGEGSQPVLCIGKAQMVFFQHIQPRINKAKLKTDKQHDSQEHL